MISGEEFNKIYPNADVVVLTAPFYNEERFEYYGNGRHTFPIYFDPTRHIVYGDNGDFWQGLNVLSQTINFDKNDTNNGLSCYFKKDFPKYFEHNCTIASIMWTAIIPDDAKVVVTGDKIKVNKFILSDKRNSLTKENCIDAINQNGISLSNVPKEFLTEDLCLYAITQNNDSLCDMELKYRTYNMCLSAVAHDEYALEYVPEELRTSELCLCSVLHDGDTLRDVPDELRTYELCLAAVTQSCSAMLYVPEKHKSYDMCMIAIKQDGLCVGLIPDEYITIDLCLEAVKKNKRAIDFIPKKFKSKIRNMLNANQFRRKKKKQ